MTTTTDLEGTSVFRRTQDVVCRSVGAESILVPIRNNVGNLDFVYTLSPVAARIWALLDGVKTADAVVDEICAEYDVDRETAQADMSALVHDLAGVSLITRVA
ncbi:MAG TPA: PqqD family protein [Thermoanaerobaculia bacterium]|nr:PqqD family protein [Thermoanaerobaculia bacterium]